jgi:hypothetical protein
MELQKSANMRVKAAFIEIPVPNLIRFVCVFFLCRFYGSDLKKISFKKI